MNYLRLNIPAIVGGAALVAGQGYAIATFAQIKTTSAAAVSISSKARDESSNPATESRSAELPDVVVDSGVVRHYLARVEQDLQRQIEQCIALQDDWDDDGATAPTVAAGQRATETVRLLLEGSLVPDEVTPDAMGGLAVWLSAGGRDTPIHRWVWVSCPNSGGVHAILDDRAKGVAPRAIVFNSESIAEIASFLRGTA